MKKINKKGFTLIELLVVIAIIGLLSTLAVVALNNARAKSRDAKRVADVKQMQTALELYYNDCDGYPLQDAPAEIVDPSTLDDGCPTNVSLATFMSQIPEAPTPIDGTGVAIGCTDTNAVYQYRSYNADGSAGCGATGPCPIYTISYCLGGSTGGLGDGPKTANPGGMQ